MNPTRNFLSSEESNTFFLHLDRLELKKQKHLLLQVCFNCSLFITHLILTKYTSRSLRSFEIVLALNGARHYTNTFVLVFVSFDLYRNYYHKVTNSRTSQSKMENLGK